MTELPTAEEVLGADEKNGLPTAEQVLGPSTDAIQGIDERLANAAHTAFSGIIPAWKRTLQPIEEGAKIGFGEEPIATPSTALSDQTVDALKKAGFFNDYEKGQNALVRTWAEEGMRVGAAALQLGMRSLSAVGAAGAQFVGQHVEDEGLAPKGSLTGTEGLTGFFTDPSAAIALGIPEAVGPFERANEIAREVQKGRSIGTVGGGEPNYFDLKPLTPQELQARQDAVQTLPGGIGRWTPEKLLEVRHPAETEKFVNKAVTAPQPEPGAEQGPPETLLALPPVSNVHEAAQRIDPEALQQYSGLAVQKDAQQKAVDSLKAQVLDPEKADIKPALEKAIAKQTEALLQTEAKQQSVWEDVDAAYRQAYEHAPDLKAGDLPSEIAKKLEVEKEAEAKIESEEPTAPPTGGVVSPSGQRSAPGEKVRLVTGVKAVEGEGETKTRGAALSIEADAVKRGIQEDFGDLPEYKVSNQDAQAKMALDYVGKNYDKALDILMRDKEAPPNILKGALLEAVSHTALAKGDFETVRQLAVNSKYVESLTTYGQESSFIQRLNEESPVGAVMKVQKAREAQLPPDAVAKSVAEEVKNMKQEIGNTSLSYDPAKWNEFIDKITCHG